MKLNKINKLSIVKNAYVQGLAHIHSPPTNLYYRGEIPDTRRQTVAIIGSRKPSAYGERVTYDIAHRLARAGVVIVSGLAFGIDAIAHEAALDAGGTTIAVLASGVDEISPHAHRTLADRILKQGGAIISEYPAGTPALRHRFLERNRLISGLSDAIVITEATERSGSLSTAGHALEQGKDIYAVPGPITSLLSAGPNRLIYQGATPVLSPGWLCNEILPNQTAQVSLFTHAANPEEQQVLEAIGANANTIDQIHTHTRLDTQKLLQLLTALELQGAVVARAGKWTRTDL